MFDRVDDVALEGRFDPVKTHAVMGAAHQQSFDVACEIAELRLSERGMGGSRRAAEQAAATAMLNTIHTKVDHAN